MPKRLGLAASPRELAKHYRYRSKQLRVIAAEWADSGMREILMRVAKNYDHMAQRSEKQAQFAEPARISTTGLVSAGAGIGGYSPRKSPAEAGLSPEA